MYQQSYGTTESTESSTKSSIENSFHNQLKAYTIHKLPTLCTVTVDGHASPTSHRSPHDSKKFAPIWAAPAEPGPIGVFGEVI